jgi:SAM-dependent methyltransferase
MIGDTHPALLSRRIPCAAPVIRAPDLFTAALMDRGGSGDLMVERAGGGLHPTSLRWWLREPAASDPIDFAALDLVRSGPVLDIGCATGRHVEALRRSGVAADGIDINPAAIDLAREHGCHVQHADYWTFDAPHRYQWLIALGNNLGIAERFSDLPAFLDRLSDLLVIGGQVLLSSVDCRHPSAAAITSSGELRLRHHYGGQCGEWFQWLYATPEALAIFARLSGFTCRVVHQFAEVYVAVLTLTSARPAPAA